MNSKNLVALVLCVSFALVLLPACGGEVNMYGDEGPDCVVDPSTPTMEATWAEADTYMRTCMLESRDAVHLCNYHIEETGMSQEECVAETFKSEQVCTYYYAVRINRIPLRECGVEVFHLLVDYDDVMNGVLPSGTQIWEVNMGDDDGDGIATWFEKMMGYNPCTPYSFGVCQPDADLDYDDDGIPNGVDDANNPDGDGSPICNWDDPGLWSTECI